MHSFHKERLLPNSPAQVFDLILDVESYPEFVPWCETVTVISKNQEEIIAKMKVNYKGFSETYSSRITTKRNGGRFVVEVKAVDGPFKFLNNYWTITQADNGCKIDFHIDLEFKSFLLDKMLGLFFASASERMIEAFEDKAMKEYLK